MQNISFDEVVDLIVAQDPRYQREAYRLVREALDFTQSQLPKSTGPEIRHVTGQELVEGFRQYTLQQFGPMSLAVLDEWGIHQTEDIGELVFNMIESGLLSKTDQDTRDHFKNLYEFEAAFRKPFLPASATKTLLDPHPPITPIS